MHRYFARVCSLAWAGLTWYLTTTPDFHPSPDTLISFFLSNGGHFIFFGILAVLLRLSITTKYHKSTTYYALVITCLYGLLIELVQRHIPGRSFSLIDLSLDSLGAIFFLAIINRYLRNFKHS